MYWVVFVYTQQAKAYAGVRTMTCFPSEADFKSRTIPLVENGHERVLAEGISEEEAKRLVALTPLTNLLLAETQNMEEMGLPRTTQALYLQQITAILTTHMGGD